MKEDEFVEYLFVDGLVLGRARTQRYGRLRWRRWFGGKAENELGIFEATNDDLYFLVDFVLLEYSLDGYASNADDIFALNRYKYIALMVLFFV